jgi:hypothetical protein
MAVGTAVGPDEAGGEEASGVEEAGEAVLAEGATTATDGLAGGVVPAAVGATLAVDEVHAARPMTDRTRSARVAPIANG